MLPIYDDATLRSYRGKNRRTSPSRSYRLTAPVEMPPHVYAIAESMYYNLKSYSESAWRRREATSDSARPVLHHQWRVGRRQDRGGQESARLSLCLALTPAGHGVRDTMTALSLTAQVHRRCVRLERRRRHHEHQGHRPGCAHCAPRMADAQLRTRCSSHLAAPRRCETTTRVDTCVDQRPSRAHAIRASSSRSSSTARAHRSARRSPTTCSVRAS